MTSTSFFYFLSSARFFGELLDGDAYLIVAARFLGHGHSECLPAPGVDREGTSAHAPSLSPEPQLVVFVLRWLRQPPDLQLGPGVGIFFAHAQLASCFGREVGSVEVGRGDLVRREEPGGVE